VEKAESLLLEIKRLIDQQTGEVVLRKFVAEVKRLSDEFYEHLPHDNKHRVVIDSKQLIASKQQLCQVCVHDIIESNMLMPDLILIFGWDCLSLAFIQYINGKLLVSAPYGNSSL